MTTDEMIRWYLAGYSAGSIARAAGMQTAAVYNRLLRAGVHRGGGVGRRDDLPIPPLPPALPVDEDGILAREGGAVYTLRDDDVYVSIGGSAARVYCRVHNWPDTPAARRLATPKRTIEAWEPDRLPWNGAPIGGERV